VTEMGTAGVGGTTAGVPGRGVSTISCDIDEMRYLMSMYFEG